jgi:hydroxymethylpyrimidine/phosphomethylpyrimidine kinase
MQLMSRCRLVTPNLPEAEALSGHDVSRRSGIEKAARFFVEDLGAGAALVKGGHGTANGGIVADLLACRDDTGEVSFRWLEAERIEAGPVHGTGCALSAAIAAGLARGAPLPEAVDRARSFVTEAITRSQAPGGGARLLVYP